MSSAGRGRLYGLERAFGERDERDGTGSKAFHTAVGVANDWPDRCSGRDIGTTRTSEIEMAARQLWLAQRHPRPFVALEQTSWHTKLSLSTTQVWLAWPLRCESIVLLDLIHSLLVLKAARRYASATH